VVFASGGSGGDEIGMIEMPFGGRCATRGRAGRRVRLPRGHGAAQDLSWQRSTPRDDDG